MVALSVIGAAVIHLAAVRSHLGSPAAVASFVGIGLVQILLGASYLFSGAERLKRFVLVGTGSLATGAWLVSRTWGLPALSGHTGAEAVGAADAAAVVLQVVSVLFALLPVRNPGPHPRIRAALATIPAFAVGAIASASLLSVPPHSHEHGPESGPRPPRAAYVDGATLIKRSRPVPVTTAATTTPTAHLDAPGAPAHSH